VGEDDLAHALDVVARIVADSVAADGESPLDEAAQLALRHGLGKTRLWTYDDVGFALLRGTDLDLAVAPASRARGVGAALARTAIAAAPTGLTAWSHADHPAAARLAEDLGYTASRKLWVMTRDAGPVDVPEIEGVTIRGYRDTDADEVLRVNAAAFADHPEQGSMDAANLADRMAEPWFDPAGLLVADGGDGLLAFHWTKQHDSELGEVYVVAVDPAAQGRGLGKAVTAAGLAHLAAHGVRRILLYVESDNAPAIATYAKLGFEHTSTHVQYTRL